MDQAAIDAAKALSSGDAKFILAAGLVMAVIVAGWLGRQLYSELKSCNAQMLDLTSRKIESDHKIADAIDSNTQVMRAALDALRKT